jgi:hypothetical protein
MGEMRNAYNIVFGKPAEKRPLGRLGDIGLDELILKQFVKK